MCKRFTILFCTVSDSQIQDNIALIHTYLKNNSHSFPLSVTFTLNGTSYSVELLKQLFHHILEISRYIWKQKQAKVDENNKVLSVFLYYQDKVKWNTNCAYLIKTYQTTHDRIIGSIRDIQLEIFRFNLNFIMSIIIIQLPEFSMYWFNM